MALMMFYYIIFTLVDYTKDKSCVEISISTGHTNRERHFLIRTFSSVDINNLAFIP